MDSPKPCASVKTHEYQQRAEKDTIRHIIANLLLFFTRVRYKNISELEEVTMFHVCLKSVFAFSEQPPGQSAEEFTARPEVWK